MTQNIRNAVFGYNTSLPRTVSLGKPHLDKGGLSHVWLMKKAGFMHWQAIAETLDCNPSLWVDRSGDRCLASVVAATLTGSCAAFQDETKCTLRMVSPPREETGWLSQVDLEAQSGERVCVEIMSAFKKMPTPSHANVVRLNSTATRASNWSDPTTRRANILRNLGQVELQRARVDATPVHDAVTVSETDHLNGAGLVFFAVVKKFFADAETKAMSDSQTASQLVTRRVHFYADLQPGDTLDIATEVTPNVHNLPAWSIAFSHARRRSDGRVVASCESSYRV